MRFDDIKLIIDEKINGRNFKLGSDLYKKDSLILTKNTNLDIPTLEQIANFGYNKIMVESDIDEDIQIETIMNQNFYNDTIAKIEDLFNNIKRKKNSIDFFHNYNPYFYKIYQEIKNYKKGQFAMTNLSNSENKKKLDEIIIGSFLAEKFFKEVKQINTIKRKEKVMNTIYGLIFYDINTKDINEEKLEENSTFMKKMGFLPVATSIPSKLINTNNTSLNYKKLYEAEIAKISIDYIKYLNHKKNFNKGYNKIMNDPEEKYDKEVKKYFGKYVSPIPKGTRVALNVKNVLKNNKNPHALVLETNIKDQSRPKVRLIQRPGIEIDLSKVPEIQIYSIFS